MNKLSTLELWTLVYIFYRCHNINMDISRRCVLNALLVVSILLFLYHICICKHDSFYNKMSRFKKSGFHKPYPNNEGFHMQNMGEYSRSYTQPEYTGCPPWGICDKNTELPSRTGWTWG